MFVSCRSFLWSYSSYSKYGNNTLERKRSCDSSVSKATEWITVTQFIVGTRVFLFSRTKSQPTLSHVQWIQEILSPGHSGWSVKLNTCLQLEPRVTMCAAFSSHPPTMCFLDLMLRHTEQIFNHFVGSKGFLCKVNVRVSSNLAVNHW
jgi:hypothetical protein